MKWLHDRQPISLSEEAVAHWIDPVLSPSQILADVTDSFATCPPRLVFTPVSRAVNKQSYQESDCTTKIEIDDTSKSSIARFFVDDRSGDAKRQNAPATPPVHPAKKRKINSDSSQKREKAKKSRGTSLDGFVTR